MTEQLDAPIVAPTNGVPKAAPAPVQPTSPPQPAGESTPAAGQPGAPQKPADRPASAPPPGKKITGKRIALATLLLVVVAAGAYLVWKVFFATPPVPDSILVLSGRIEGDDSAVAAKTTGRILEIRVREGDVVKAGDIIAVLDDQQIRDREVQAQAVLTGGEAKAAAALIQIAFFEEQLRQNQLQTEQSSVDAQGRVRQAEADLAAAEADVDQQEAAYRIALFDQTAYTALAKTGAVSERQGKQAVSTAGQQGAAVAAATRRAEASQGSLTTARATLSNPGIREAQVGMANQQIAQQQAEVSSARANTEQARFQLAEAQANRRDLIVRAPFDGTVITRAAEPGEVIAAGTAVVSLLDLSKVYLRGFLPEGRIGKVKIGQPAHVYLDSNPKQPVDAYVSRIDPEATFTPENTYFKDDRVTQVVGVKLQLKSAIGFAKPGMPADGEILVEGAAWPNRSKARK
ncbi:MAG: HlyD family efflux transporter periplasmic adaptor subunit [Bryobacteraceae bacterium]|jgi:HlyD family secretion protein